MSVDGEHCINQGLRGLKTVDLFSPSCKTRQNYHFQRFSQDGSGTHWVCFQFFQLKSHRCLLHSKKVNPQQRMFMAMPDPYDQTGQTLRGYTLLEKVAKGSQAFVYKARHETTGEIVAVKILLPEYIQNSEFSKRFD